MKVKAELSRVRLFVTPWTIQSMEFSRPEYGVGSLSSPGDLPNPGIEPRSPALRVDSLPAETPGKPNNLEINYTSILKSQPNKKTSTKQTKVKL